ncbi:hypothetical protein [Thermanaerosceptrum fracticalcis]|nr:hypothetical protein [Thermanaerosceptrum fracticalcis]
MILHTMNFGGTDFEGGVRQYICNRFPNIKMIQPGKSNEVKELQAADVCIGCMRRSLNNEDMDNFSHLMQISIFAEVIMPRDHGKNVKFIQNYGLLMGTPVILL